MPTRQKQLSQAIMEAIIDMTASEIEEIVHTLRDILAHEPLISSRSKAAIRIAIAKLKLAKAAAELYDCVHVKLNAFSTAQQNPPRLCSSEYPQTERVTFLGFVRSGGGS